MRLTQRHLAENAPTALQLVQSNSLPALVQVEIEQMILRGDLAVGGHVNESELNSEHAAVVHALVARDGARAGRLLRRHAAMSRARMHKAADAT